MANQYRAEIQQMMFVAGESAEVPPETTSIVESIVRQQTVELFSRANDLSNRRGSKAITCEDIIFLIRHDKEKVSRLKTFLKWKELRKNAKDKDDKPEAVDGEFNDTQTLLFGGTGGDSARRVKGPTIILPWDVPSYFSERVPQLEDEDREETEANEVQLQRLKLADERTKSMTREEYCEWAEARQATFTRGKRSKFRQWSSLGAVTDCKIAEDVMDVFGFLTFQMVQTLTEEAVKVKGAEQAFLKNCGEHQQNRTTSDGPFLAKYMATTAVQPQHIQEAFFRLQHKNTRQFMRHKSRSLKLVSHFKAIQN